MKHLKQYRKSQKKLNGYEIRIAKGISLGYTEKELAVRMFRSEATVHTHKSRFMQKTGCRNIADITRYYLNNYDPVIKTRTQMAFARGRRIGTLKSRFNSTASVAVASLQNLWKAQNCKPPANRAFAPDQTRQAYILQLVGTSVNNNRKYPVMSNPKNYVELDKIEVLQWLNANSTLSQLIEIKNFIEKSQKTKKNENSKRTVKSH